MPEPAQPRSLRLEQALHGIAALLALATLLWFVWGLNRGLEFTDESYYLLSAIHADQIGLFFSPAHWVSGVLWQASQSLAGFRALGLGLCVLSALVLAWGVLRMAAVAGLVNTAISRSGQMAVFATTTSAALLYGSLLNFTPSYNLLAASGAYMSAGLGLLMISAKAGSRQAWLLAVACGVALGVTVLCKFSSGIATAALLLALQMLWHWRCWSSRLWHLLLMLACMVAAIVAVMLLQTGFAEAVRQFQAGITLVWFAQGDHTTSGRLLRSAVDMTHLAVAAAGAFWVPLVCFALAAFWRPFWMASLGLVCFGALLFTGNHLAAGMGNYALQAVPLAALLACMLLLTAKSWLPSRHSVLLVLALLVLPIGIAIGTWNPLQIQILTALAPWGALVGLLLALSAGLSGARLRWVTATCAALFGLVVLLQTLGSAGRPYRLQPLALQTEKVAIGALDIVKVDSKTAALVRAIQAAGQHCGIAPGTPFVDLYNLPAVGLMLDAVPVVSPWLLNAGYADRVLRQASPDLLQQAVVVVKREAAEQVPFRPPSQLAGFPDGYRLCGQGVNPLDGLAVQLWAPE